MTAPNLMPFQDQPFNGDTFICEEFLKLKHRFGIVDAVETGTCLGSTTLFLSNNFRHVFTAEVNKQYAGIAKQKFVSRKNIRLHICESVRMLDDIVHALKERTIYFLDAHWANHCPLLDELGKLSICVIPPIITIHDFLVPGAMNLGYDSYNGQEFTFEWIKEKLEAVYPAGYDYYYNSDEQAAGARRGIVYITPRV